MPWKRRKVAGTCGRKALLCVVAAGLLGGLLACVLGAALRAGSSALAEKYSAYKRLTGTYTPEQLKKAAAKFNLSR